MTVGRRVVGTSPTLLPRHASSSFSARPRPGGRRRPRCVGGDTTHVQGAAGRGLGTRANSGAWHLPSRLQSLKNHPD